MNLSRHAMSTPATDDHNFYILNIYTGHRYECRLQRETACYYIVEVTGILSGHRVAVRRFHKATMCIDECCLYIGNVKEETAARIAAVKDADHCPNCEQVCTGQTLTVSAHSDVMLCVDCAKDEHDDLKDDDNGDDSGPSIAFISAHDKPHFCPACECYAKADEMTASAWVTMPICIDCATAEEDALAATLRGIPECKTTYAMCPAEDRDREIVEAVLEMNYIGGHLAGYHFTPTLKELPRNLFAYQPNNGKAGSPNALINKLGMFVVNLRRGFDTRAIYGPMGNYLIHGDYDVINAYLLAIIDGE